MGKRENMSQPRICLLPETICNNWQETKQLAKAKGHKEAQLEKVELLFDETIECDNGNMFVVGRHTENDYTYLAFCRVDNDGYYDCLLLKDNVDIAIVI